MREVAASLSTLLDFFLLNENHTVSNFLMFSYRLYIIAMLVLKVVGYTLFVADGHVETLDFPRSPCLVRAGMFE